MAEEKDLNVIASSIASSKEALSNPETAQILSEATVALKDQLGIDIPEELLIQIGTMFTLSDEHFEIISNEFLKAFEGSLNNPADKIAICQMLNLSNVKSEDLIAAGVEWDRVIDESFDEKFSQIKKDFLKKVFHTVINAVMDSEGISKRIINVPIVVGEGATLPAYAKIGDAGVDVCAIEEITLKPGETKIIPTGLKVQLPIGYELQVRPRSGLSAKSKLRVANAPGTIDSGYRDEIGIIIENTEPKIKDIDFEYNDDGSMNIKSVVFGAAITIEKGQRIAQLVLSEVPTIKFMEVSELNLDNDRQGGFGSTGA